MQYFDLNEIGMLVLRIAVAYIYLHGAYMIGSTKKKEADWNSKNKHPFWGFK
jgi:hypothetical protein